MKQFIIFWVYGFFLTSLVWGFESNRATFHSSQNDTLILQPGSEGKDCYICDCSPNVNSPNGGKTFLYQGQYQTCYDRMLIQWDLSALPPNRNIIQAEMKLYCYNRYGTKASGKMTYYRITSFWNEDSVTYNTRPDTSHDVTATVNQWPSGTNWHSIDITQFVQGWYQGTFPNYGLYGHCIQTSGTCVAGFHSSDHANASQRPQLIIIYSSASGVKNNDKNQPEQFLLLQNYPNPFNSTTTIKYAIPQEELVSLIVYDFLGRAIGVLVDERQSPGNYEIQFNGKYLPSGVYFFKIQAGNFVDIKKAILLR